MSFFRFLLFPFSIVYFLITRLRNYLFDIGYTKAFQFEVKTIVVGNLSAGGTGKTPMIEYLIRLIKNKYKVATLSRGYGRRTKGFLIAKEEHNSHLIGDEPRQFHLKFKEEISVCVGEDRALAIPEILYNKPDVEVILLDDAFQHRYIIPGINILLSDYNNVFYKDFILPVGNLRESRAGARRADIVIITKCPGNISEENMLNIKFNCYKYIKKETPVFFSAISYLKPVPVFEVYEKAFSTNVMLFTGIGKSSYVEKFISERYNLMQFVSFSDHYNYSIKDVEAIKNKFDKIPGEDKCLLTTEKDMVKLMELDLDDGLMELPLFYLPIEMKILHQKQFFDGLVMSYVSNLNFN